MFLCIDLAGQGAAPVPLAGVLALLAARAEEPGVETEVGAQPRLLQLPLAVKIQEHGDINILDPDRAVINLLVVILLTSYLEGVLISSIWAKNILAPATDKASTASKPLKMIYIIEIQI